MSIALAVLNKIPAKYQFTVFGYLREQETQLSLDTIPPLVCYLLLKFYYPGEYFKKYSKNIILSDNDMTITRISKPGMDGIWTNYAIGSIAIDSTSKCIAKWTFKLNYINPELACNIGQVTFLLLSNPSKFESNKRTKPHYQINANYH